MASLQKRRLFGLLLCASLSACEDAEEQDDPLHDAGVDATIIVPDASAAMDAEVADANTRDASAPDAPYLVADKRIAAFPSAVNKPTLTLAVSDQTPSCEAGELVCNGVCLPRVKGATGNGCTVVNADFLWLDRLYVHDRVGYGLGSLTRPDNFSSSTFAVPLDGSAAVRNDNTLNLADALGMHDGQLIVFAGSGDDCNATSYKSRCLQAVSATSGQTSVLSGAYFNAHAKLGVRSVFVLREESPGVTSVHQRDLFEGKPVLRFRAPNNVQDFISDDTWAFFSRREDAGSRLFLLTKLGETGMTFQLPEAGEDVYSDHFFRDGYLYLLRRRGDEAADYQRLKPGEDRGETLALLPVLATQLVVHGEWVYFRGVTGRQDWLYRMPLLGGPVTVIATFGTGVLRHYFATDEGVYAQVSLPGATPFDARTILLRVALPQ